MSTCSMYYHNIANCNDDMKCIFLTKSLVLVLHTFLFISLTRSLFFFFQFQKNVYNSNVADWCNLYKIQWSIHSHGARFTQNCLFGMLGKLLLFYCVYCVISQRLTFLTSKIEVIFRVQWFIQMVSHSALVCGLIVYFRIYLIDR